MSEPTSGQSGGINNPGTLNTGGGDAVGRDKTTTTTYYSPTEIHNAWQPVVDAIRTAPPEKQAEAVAKLDALKKEGAKGDKAEDTTNPMTVYEFYGKSAWKNLPLQPPPTLIHRTRPICQCDRVVPR
jgi:hypothetical protein